MPTPLSELAAVQQLLLPAALPAVPGWQFAAHYRPCDAAGGDFYGCRVMPAGRLGVLVADVSGHGVRAAVVMAMFRAWLESLRLFDRPIDQIAADLNALLRQVQGLDVFVTAVFLDLDPADGSCRYINCGHPPPLLRHGTDVAPLADGRTIPLGLLDDLDPVVPGVATIEPGDTLALYTDGITEARDPAGTFFDAPRLAAAVAAGSDAPATLAAITSAVAAFRGPRPPADDECVLTIHRRDL